MAFRGWIFSAPPAYVLLSPNLNSIFSRKNSLDPPTALLRVLSAHENKQKRKAKRKRRRYMDRVGRQELGDWEVWKP